MENSSWPTLRQLPLAAKLVLTVFLVAVGLGYLSAMVQLHFKHASKGNSLPSLLDVVERFSGRTPPWNPDAPVPEPADANGAAPAAPKGDAPLVAAAKIKTIITVRCTECHCNGGDPGEPILDSWPTLKKQLGDSPQKCNIFRVLNKTVTNPENDNLTKDNMNKAFSLKSSDNGVEWKDLIKDRPEAELRAQRDAERLALVSWLEAGAPEENYEKDAFPLPLELRKDGAVKLLDNFQTKAPELAKPAPGAPAPKKKRNAKDRQLSVESLTQSTHAHLLTFAVLWTVTGLIFAFSTYPCWVRTLLAPAVLLAQVADVSCWWLARLPDVGPYFAAAIMGTGAVVGLGLVAQIVLSLFNLYGGKGKVVLLVIGIAVAAGLYAGYAKYVEPELVAEKIEAAK
jgi:hypothetical protein